jgi:hypothetical protein
MDRGKRRSLAQRIGNKGEKHFALWATDRGLSPNKVEDDYGVDYLCQVLRPVRKSSSEEAAGTVFAAQVKATNGKKRPRVTLNREDAVNLLRQANATALIAVGPEEPYVRFLFLDETFIDRLREFLTCANRSISIRLEEMNSDVAEFDQKLAYLSRPGTQHRLKIYKVQRDLAALIPGSTLSIQQFPSGGIAVVDVPWLPSALHIEPGAREKVRKLVFEEGKLPGGLAGISLRPALLQVHDLVDGPVLLQGGIEQDVELTAHSGDTDAKATFHARRLSDETAYTHPAGLSFIISDRRKHQNRWVHEFQIRVFNGERSLGEAKDLVSFLRLLRPGAEILIDDKPFISVDKFGDAASGLGAAIEALEGIANARSISAGWAGIGSPRIS